jgi:hypothetical protein
MATAEHSALANRTRVCSRCGALARVRLVDALAHRVELRIKAARALGRRLGAEGGLERRLSSFSSRSAAGTSLHEHAMYARLRRSPLCKAVSSPHVPQMGLIGFTFCPPAAMSVMNFFDTSLRPACPPHCSQTSAWHSMREMRAHNMKYHGCDGRRRDA